MHMRNKERRKKKRKKCGRVSHGTGNMREFFVFWGKKMHLNKIRGLFGKRKKETNADGPMLDPKVARQRGWLPPSLDDGQCQAMLMKTLTWKSDTGYELNLRLVFRKFEV